MVLRFALLILILPIGFPHTSYAQESVDRLSSNDTGLKVAYIGNMGVLIEHNEKTVLFDGFHKEYKPDYIFPDQTMVTDLTDGTYTDFSSVEIALFSHKHADHFDALYAQRFLKENPNGIVVGPNQIKKEIQNAHNEFKQVKENFLKNGVVYKSKRTI